MWENTTRAIQEYRDGIVNRSKANLAMQGRNASGKLSDSIVGSPVKRNKGEFVFDIEMELYGEFLDKGVNGKKSAYTTPYSYKDKMPPPQKLDKWIVRRKIAPRDENGKFLPRKSVQFLIARGIFQNGIKPSLFFTEAYKEMTKNVGDKILEAIKLDTREQRKKK